MAGAAPGRKSHGSFVSFEDLDGHGWPVRNIPPAGLAGDQRPEGRKEQDIMTHSLTYQQMGTAARGQAHALFAQTMG